MGNFAIRNLSERAHEWIRRRASARRSSVEHEAREILETAAVGDTAVRYPMHVAQRIKTLLESYNEGQNITTKPSHISMRLGHDVGSVFDDWLNALKEPSFKDMADICELFGANLDWLAHGDGQPFTVERLHTFEYKYICEILSRPTIRHVHFIRANSSDGELAIIVRADNDTFKTYSTPLHVSENVGATGEAMLVTLSNVCQYFWVYRRDNNIDVSSHILDYDLYISLIHGIKHPRAILKRCRSVYWWEEIYEPHREGGAASFWPGFSELQKQIGFYVENATWAKRDRVLAEAGMREAE